MRQESPLVLSPTYSRTEVQINPDLRPEEFPKAKIELYQAEPLELNAPFYPYTQDEAGLVTFGGVYCLTKVFKFNSVVGDLFLRITRSRDAFFLTKEKAGRGTWEYEHFYSPWEATHLNPQTLPNYPLEIGMCFNNTAQVTPTFKFRFPGTPREVFWGHVSDWDVNEEFGWYDATHYMYLPDGRNVFLMLPLDPQQIASLVITARDNFMRYPDLVTPKR